MAGPAQGNNMMLARLLMGQKQQQGGANPFNVPFTGLRNEPGTLPAFEPPGGSLPMDRYMPPDGGMPGAPRLPPVSQPAAGPTAGAPVTEPVPIPPVDMPAEVSPMPAPIHVGDGSVKGDMATMAQQAVAQGKITPDQFAAMFPQWAGGSMTQLRGG